MKKFDLDKVILGHNQFFGVSHSSSEKGIQREQYFQNIDNIIHVIKMAKANGATAMMMSTHERAKLVAEKMRNHPELKDFNIYILLPYLAKYVKMANEKGLLKMVSELLSTTSWTDRFSIGMTGALGVIKGDQLKKLQALIDLEMAPFKGLNVKAVYLHNSLTDLSVGLGLYGIFDFFEYYIAERYQAQPAFCSLSSHTLMNFLKETGRENPVIMAPFNPLGFQMGPSREQCEQTLIDYPCQMTAMSILAAGVVSPAKAKEYIDTLPIKSIILGASNQKHIESSFPLFADN